METTAPFTGNNAQAFITTKMTFRIPWGHIGCVRYHSSLSITPLRSGGDEKNSQYAGKPMSQTTEKNARRNKRDMSNE